MQQPRLYRSKEETRVMGEAKHQRPGTCLVAEYLCCWWECARTYVDFQRVSPHLLEREREREKEREHHRHHRHSHTWTETAAVAARTQRLQCYSCNSSSCNSSCGSASIYKSCLLKSFILLNSNFNQFMGVILVYLSSNHCSLKV